MKEGMGLRIRDTSEEYIEELKVKKWVRRIEERFFFNGERFFLIVIIICVRVVLLEEFFWYKFIICI